MSDLTLELEVPPHVMRGFPVWAGVTVSNVTDHVAFCAVPSCTPLAPGSPLGLVFRSEAGEEREVPAAVDHLEDGADGEPLRPRAIRRSTEDLSSAIAELPAGRWQVTARLDEPRVVVSAPIAFEVVDPTPEDAEVAARLAARNDVGEVGWSWFLLAGGSRLEPEELEGLGPEGREVLRLWLFLHDAIQGDVPPSALDASALDPLDGPALGLEGALLRHEILCLQGAPWAEGLSAAIEERWPGVEERLEDNRSGEGLLTTLRAYFGPRG